jgi:hypothetical protein
MCDDDRVALDASSLSCAAKEPLTGLGCCESVATESLAHSFSEKVVRQLSIAIRFEPMKFCSTIQTG